MSGVADMSRGLRSIAAIKTALAKGTPLAIADATAADAASFLTEKVREEFDAGLNVYDETRALGVEGNVLKLVSGSPLPAYTKKKPHRSRGINAPRAAPGQGAKRGGSGHVRDALGFVANGRIVRAKLGQPYAKYLVGKYKILPNQYAQVPANWTLGLKAIFAKHFAAFMARQGATSTGEASR